MKNPAVPETLELGGAFPLGDNEVLVVALFDGHTLPSEGERRYRFKECETGILRWQYAGSMEDHKFWELAVVWDQDPERKPRRVSHLCIQVIGFECDGHRSYAKQPEEYRAFKKTLS